MFLSVLLKSFSQTAQKSRRRTISVVAILTEQCEERRLLSATSHKIAGAIPNAPAGGSNSAGPSGATSALTNLPVLNSLAGAPVSVILKFDGYTDNDPGWIAFRDSGTGPIVTPAFDLDGDATTFNTEELRQIEEIWYRVSEDFAPFNVNVTTVTPPVLNDFEHVMVVIGGDGDWAPPAGGWGAINGFSTSSANTNYVFSELFSSPHQLASISSHESGHTFGLRHQSTYDSSGTKLQEYNPGDANLAPLMGNGYGTIRDTWWLGPNTVSATTIQDDLAQLTRAQNQTVQYRADDHGNSAASASAITVSSANVSASGIIERNNDRDFFQFTTDDGPVSFTVEGLNLRRIYSNNSLTFGTNLDAVLRLYDSSGTLVAQSNPTNSLFATVSANVTAGIYYVEVTHTGQYGSIGQYNVTGIVNPLETFSLTVDQTSVFENAGTRAAIGTVSRSDFANLSNPVVVSLSSSDTTELTVPATVTILPGSRTATFFVNAIDDQLADGTQRVNITGSATLGGELRTSTASLEVHDHETLSLTVTPSTVYENAGRGAVAVTITRSNTDTFPPNTFSVVNNQLLEHNYLGTLVRTRSIPWPAGVRPTGQNANDVVVMEDNRVAVYNGTSQAWLSVLNQSSNTWQHIAVPGLSTESAVVGTGGISTSGNFVFLTDTKESATEDNGIVRVDVNTGVSTRFATRSPGYRMFVKNTSSSANVIDEIDYLTGAVINTIPMPVANSFSFDTGLSFDGSSLWVLAGPLGNDQIYRLNPNTGAVLEIHALGANRGWDGLASLNGLLYVLDDFVENQITVYDPVQRRIINTLNVGSLNNINISGGLAAITGPDRLYVTSLVGSTMYEINPISGLITNQWSHGMGSAEGVATANNEIYIGQFVGRDLRVFNRQGLFQRNVRLTSSGVHALGGDNVLTLVDTNLRFRDVYSGLNDKIYAVDVNGSTVGRYNATTLANEAFITLASPVNALAVAADGTIWGASANGILYRFSATGAIISQVQVGTASLVDIDLNTTGQILLTNALGRLYQTNTAGATPTSFSVGNTVAFASFGRHQTLPSGPVLVQLTNSDSTAIRLPTSVVIPIGQRSVTILADVVDDNVLDGTQTSTITASALGYIGTQSRTVTVLDHESVLVNIVAGSISEAAGSGATQAHVFRTDIDGPFNYVGPRQVFANNTSQTILDNDKINSYITVPTQTSRLTDVNVSLTLNHSFLADLDIYLVSPRGTRIELVSDLLSNEPAMIGTSFDNVAPTGILTGSSPFTGRFRPEGTLEDLNGENPTGVWTLEITDDNPTDFGTLMSWGLNIETIGLAPITVNLTKTGDTDEIGVQSTVVIPANQSSVFVPVNAIDDTILDGTRISGLRATTTSAGYFSGTDNVSVLDRETLRFTVNKTTVPETAGVGAITGTLTRLNTDINSSFTVSMTSSDLSEITVPATVTFLPGRSSVSFPITVVDDTSSDGTQMVTVRAVTSQYVVDKNQIISVTDVEPKLVLSSSVSTVAENAGSFVATVTRQQTTDISRPVVVSLSVSAFTGLSSPIRVPATVTIPAGRVDQTFVVTVLDDRLLDGTQTATILAKSAGATEGSTTIRVTDHETLSLSLNKTNVREDAGRAAVRGTVTRSNLDYAFAITVTLTSSDVSEIRVPVRITLPAGQSSVSFDLEAVNDTSIDGSQTVRISASAPNYMGASSTIIVDDHEPPVVTAPAPTIVDPNPVVQWNAVPLATRYEVLLQNLSAGTEQRYQVPRTSTTFKIQKPVADSLGLGRYRVLVRAYDQLERAGFWSVARDFRVVTAPKIIGPSTASSLVSGTFPEIVWTPVLDASGYELTVHNLTTGKMNVISQKNLPTSSYRAMEVLGTGTFRATVRAFLSAPVRGQAPVIDYGNFSASLDFTVLSAPSVLTPVSGGTFDRSPMLSWSRVIGASTYDVMVRNAQTRVIVFRDQSVPGTSIRIPQDLQNANYEVLVRAQTGRFFSAWSASRLFGVGAAPGITSPLANQTTGAQPKFVWTSITGAERYEVWVLNRDTNAYAVQVSNVTGNSFTPATKLPLGAYRVTVRAISQLGDVTNWSAPVYFVGGAAPVISRPTNNSTNGSKPSIAWSAVEGATAYNVRIVNLANNATVVATGNLTSTVFTPSTNLAAGKYRIWVRAVSAQGHLSNWSTAVDITVASNGIEEDFATFGTPVVAAVLPDREAEFMPTVAEATSRRTSSSTNFITAVVQNVAEQANSADGSLEAESIAAATDHVMAAWDVSDWWNTAVVVNKRDNEVM
jgi:subtilisin-like proprotein convertase family protein